jgi:hypothetical protein
MKGSVGSSIALEIRLDISAVIVGLSADAIDRGIVDATKRAFSQPEPARRRCHKLVVARARR